MNEQNDWKSEAERPQIEQRHMGTPGPGGVRVYDRPARRSSPMIFIIVFLILAALAAILFFQFIR
jgi:hypothetical protein